MDSSRVSIEEGDEGDEDEEEEDDESFQVMLVDFEKALTEVKPSFGLQLGSVGSLGGGQELFSGRSHVDHRATSLLLDRLSTALTDHESNDGAVASKRGCLLMGEGSGVGATTMAVQAAVASGAPFVRVVSPSDVAGKT